VQHPNHSNTGPITGPYYWIPTIDGWELLSFPDTIFENDNHDHIWSTMVAPHLGNIWCLTDKIILALAKYPYGVSRGRVSRGYPKESGVYYLNHGDDAPLPHMEAIPLIIKEFNLDDVRSQGKLKIVYDDHETMLQLHKFKVESFISSDITEMRKNFMTAVREACRNALLDEIGQIDIVDWQAEYDRTENIAQFVSTAKKCGFEAQDEGDGTISIAPGNSGVELPDRE